MTDRAVQVYKGNSIRYRITWWIPGRETPVLRRVIMHSTRIDAIAVAGRRAKQISTTYRLKADDVRWEIEKLAGGCDRWEIVTTSAHHIWASRDNATR